MSICTLRYLLHQEEVQTLIVQYLPIDSIMPLKEALNMELEYQMEDKHGIITVGWNVNQKEYPLVKFIEEYGSITLAMLICGIGQLDHFKFLETYGFPVKHHTLYSGDLQPYETSKMVHEMNDIELWCLSGDQLYSTHDSEFGVIRFLVNVGFDPNYGTKISEDLLNEFNLWDSINLLSNAVAMNRTGLVDCLLNLGADPNILLNLEADPNLLFVEEPCLLLAVREGDLEMARKLIEHGANINYFDAYYRSTIVSSPFNSAIESKNLDMVKLLIECGVDLKPRQIKNTRGIEIMYDPIARAMERSTPEIARYLESI